MKEFGGKGMGSLCLQRRDGVKLLSLISSTGLSSVHPCVEIQPMLKPWDESVWIHPQNQGWENSYINSMLVKKKRKPNPKPKLTPYTSPF